MATRWRKSPMSWNTSIIIINEIETELNSNNIFTHHRSVFSSLLSIRLSDFMSSSVMFIIVRNFPIFRSASNCQMFYSLSTYVTTSVWSAFIHGCRRIYSPEYRFFGFFSNNLFMKSFAEVDMYFQYWGGNSTLLSFIRLNNSSSSSDSKGLRPLSLNPCTCTECK